ncbi:MAG: histidine phosphatase family protein [Marmoricola sp.]
MSPPSPDSSSKGRRLLVIMRHGKAEAFAQGDHRRRLTDRGRREATAAGQWLADLGFVPTDAFVSSATRARQTWEALMVGSGTRAEARVEDAVYTADADSALDVLRGSPVDAEVVLYVGHNPTAASLAYLLDDGDPDSEAFRSMSVGFATAAVAVLEIWVPWADLDAATGHLIAFHADQG